MILPWLGLILQTFLRKGNPKGSYFFPLFIILLMSSATFFFSFQPAGLPCRVEGEVVHAPAPTPSAPLQEKNYSQSGLSLDSKVSHFSHLLSGSPAAGITSPPTGLFPSTGSHHSKAKQQKIWLH